MTDVYPYELPTSWTRLDPSEFVPSTIFAKDIKALRQALFIYFYTLSV